MYAGFRVTDVHSNAYVCTYVFVWEHQTEGIGLKLVKRLIAICCAAIMAVSAAACGANVDSRTEITVWSWEPSMKQVIASFEKENPESDEFWVQPEILNLIRSKDFGQYANKDGELQLCFLSNNDITGGNSGSPVFDKNARLIGLAFDGNWEAMSGDIAFEPDLQRTISVDIRYVLYMIDKWGKCPRLIEELKLVK